MHAALGACAWPPLTHFEGVREEQNRQRMEDRERISATNSELARVNHEIGGIIDAIKAGVPGAELKTEMERLQARKTAGWRHSRTA